MPTLSYVGLLRRRRGGLGFAFALEAITQPILRVILF